MRITSITPKHVEFAPEDSDMELGVRYISLRFMTTIHLCPCGCGNKVVCPIDLSRQDIEHKWLFAEVESPPEVAGRVSLIPSIGNFALPCKSHYFIMLNEIKWCD